MANQLDILVVNKNKKSALAINIAIPSERNVILIFLDYFMIQGMSGRENERSQKNTKKLGKAEKRTRKDVENEG